MKMGIRKTSIKRSIQARTTGKIKRNMKRAVNPMYGKKGMGLVNNPKKAVYNKVYSKTTVGVSDFVQGGKPARQSYGMSQPAATNAADAYTTFVVAAVIALIAAVVIILLGMLLMLIFPVFGTIVAVLGILLLILGIRCAKKAKTIKQTMMEVE